MKINGHWRTTAVAVVLLSFFLIRLIRGQDFISDLWFENIKDLLICMGFLLTADSRSSVKRIR